MKNLNRYQEVIRYGGQCWVLAEERFQRNLIKVWPGRASLSVSTSFLLFLPVLSHPAPPTPTATKKKSPLFSLAHPLYFPDSLIIKNKRATLRTPGLASQLADVSLTHSSLWLLRSVYSLMKESRPFPLVLPRCGEPSLTDPLRAVPSPVGRPVCRRGRVSD